MANSKSRLGRGLGGLISGGEGASAPEGGAEGGAAAAPSATQAGMSAAADTEGYRMVPVAEVVVSPYQARREMDEEQIRELADSIEAEGLLQPVVVRPKSGKYELIAGERRWRAFERLKQTTIPARVVEASDASSAALSLIENLQREGLNPIEEALGYASLIRDFDLTQERAAERVGKSRASIANALRLLTLGSEIQGFLSRRLLSTGHAKVLLGVENEEQRRLLARRIIEGGLSVREAERQVRRLKSGSGGGGASSGSGSESKNDAEQTAVRDLERRIGETLNTRVSVKHGAKRGKITIEYFGNEDLDRILEKLGVRQ